MGVYPLENFCQPLVSASATEDLPSYSKEKKDSLEHSSCLTFVLARQQAKILCSCKPLSRLQCHTQCYLFTHQRR